jgi:ATP-dependent Lon protease
MPDQGNKPAEKKTFSLPILPLRNTVLFPQVVIPLAVGRPKSVKLIEEAVRQRNAHCHPDSKSRQS